MKKSLIICLLILTITSAYSTCNSIMAFAEDGEIRGRVTDSLTGSGIPMANVILLKGTEIMLAITTDNNGDYVIKPLKPGSYTVQASYVGYNAHTVKEVTVNANKFTELNFLLTLRTDLPPAIVTYTPPMIEKDNVITCKILTASEIKTSPYTNIRDIAATAAGVYQKEEGGALNVRGSRASSTQYYIDGIKVQDGFTIPKSAIAQIQVITGGIPAMYGDATGGIIVITTKSYMNGW